MDRPDDDPAEKRKRDIADVIREERRRRRPLDVDQLRDAQKIRRDYLWLIRNADEATFRKALSDLGWKPGSPEFEARVRAWRELRRQSS
ncbi:MAG: hypothetical protein HY216_06575 [Candidatus Rokubacteria bacterium]|nr:hypothetical protein [Candidatus Rokubacteria bacterium]